MASRRAALSGNTSLFATFSSIVYYSKETANTDNQTYEIKRTYSTKDTKIQTIELKYVQCESTHTTYRRHRRMRSSSASQKTTDLSMLLKKNDVHANSKSVQCCVFQTWQYWLRMRSRCINSTTGRKFVAGNGFNNSDFLYDMKILVVRCSFSNILAIFHCACAVSTIFLHPV